MIKWRLAHKSTWWVVEETKKSQLKHSKYILFFQARRVDAQPEVRCRLRNQNFSYLFAKASEEMIIFNTRWPSRKNKIYFIFEFSRHVNMVVSVRLDVEPGKKVYWKKIFRAVSSCRPWVDSVVVLEKIFWKIKIFGRPRAVGQHALSSNDGTRG